MGYEIITDSCCDFTEELYRQLRVSRVDLTVTCRGESRSNFSDETDVQAFYGELRTGLTATTAAANPADWARVMEPHLRRGADLLVLTFSSALSATYQSAVIAAQELGETYPERTVHVVDTLCAALGQGLLVWHACRRREEGMPRKELKLWVEENRLRLCHWVTVDDLSHLKRGGRISSATALVGTMLNIKPIIHVDDRGRLINTARVRGRHAAITYIASKLEELGQDYDNDTVFIAHGDCPEDAAALEAMVKEKCGVKRVYTGYVGPVIGAHTGPGVLVLFFLGAHR